MVCNKKDSVENRLDKIITNINEINSKLTDPNHTTFICVCIPEFLSVFETERLVQSLYSYEIDSHILFVNQILLNNTNCNFCKSRQKMQDKYLDMIDDLYLDVDFSIVHIPALPEEVRNVEKIQKFSKLLYNTQIYEDTLEEIAEDDLENVEGCLENKELNLEKHLEKILEIH